jgi:SAM-dependent methyltransferase
MPTSPDTDAHWRALGDVNPYYAVCSDPRFAGRSLDVEAATAFFQSGREDIASFHSLLQAHFAAPDRFEAALDFGCGVGRLLAPMARRADRAVGVDISEGMRRLAVGRLLEEGLSRTTVLASLEEAAAVGPYNWVNSFIVLQHIPPLRGEALIEQLARITAPSGFVSLHVTAARDARHRQHRFRLPWSGLRTKLKRALGQQHTLPAGAELITMFDYDLTKVLRILEGAGFGGFFLLPTNHGGHYGYIVFGQKGA